tara:strand:+ start:637 stop:1161 length:525 start_codon:yes stop_codon:yes gene_type:complete
LATRSLNKVLLIGNLTRDPELRYTPQGTAVCTFGLATNRSWSTEEGGKREETEFHTIVAWNRLAEIVAEFLNKGKQVYVEGRLSTREWDAQDGTKRRTTEIISNEVIFLGGAPARETELDVPADLGISSQGKNSQDSPSVSPKQEVPEATEDKGKSADDKGPGKSKKGEEDIPF